MNNRVWLEANICQLGMSVLPNFITRHPLSRSMHDSCPYFSYLDTCLARVLFSILITNLENSRPRYAHLQPQCSSVVIILFQVTFGWELVVVRSRLDGITEASTKPQIRIIRQ